MTIEDVATRNGIAYGPDPTEALAPATTAPPRTGPDGTTVPPSLPGPVVSARRRFWGTAATAGVAGLEARLHARVREQDLLHRLADVCSDEVFLEVPSETEELEDRRVHEQIRKVARRDRKRAGIAEIRRARRQRTVDRWHERAEQARDRILDPARALGGDYRKLVASSWITFALILGGVAYMSRNVHDGLVGVDGTWTAYLVEPLASVLLAVSMFAQLTARQRGIPIARAFLYFDAGLLAASSLLNIIPGGLRNGWDHSDMIANVLVPGLVVAAVFAWHLVTKLYGEAIALTRDQPILIFKDDEETAANLAILRQATARGDLPADPSINQVIKTLRDNHPINHVAARRMASIYLGR